MVYRYQWAWNWHAWQRITPIDTASLVKNLEDQVRQNVSQQAGVTKIVSVTTRITSQRSEFTFPVTNFIVDGTTTTVFESTVAPEAHSPIAPIVVAIIVCAVVAAIIAIFIYLTVVDIGSTIKEVPAVVPAVAAVGLGFLAVAALAIWLMYGKKPVKEKEK